MKYLLALVLMLYAVWVMGQAKPMARGVALLLGTNRSFNQTQYRIGTIALERSLGNHGSIQFGLGLDCMSRPKSPTYQKLDGQVFAELRYYLLMRRGHTLSGLYFGVFAGANCQSWIYRAGKHAAERRTFADLGATVGYQHAIGRHLRFGQGILGGHHIGTYEIRFTPNGSISHESRVAYTWFSALWYMRLGLVF
jgi:hypothetical protein